MLMFCEIVTFRKNKLIYVSGWVIADWQILYWSSESIYLNNIALAFEQFFKPNLSLFQPKSTARNQFFIAFTTNSC